MRKSLRIITTSLVIMLLASAAVYADTYSVDAFTGEKLTKKGTQQTVGLTQNCSYSFRSGRYVFSCGPDEGDTVSSSVYDGMVVNGTVSIDAGDTVRIRVYKDAETLEDASSYDLRDPGSYRVVQLGSAGSESVILDFMIVGNRTNAVTTFTVPSGFIISSATKDGQPAEYSISEVLMEEEGTYSVKYTCQYTGIVYYLDTTIDRTPPELLLAAVENYQAHGPVDISDLEEGCEITILRDDEQIQYTEVLEDAGNYNITLKDEAGNYTNYVFIINVYFDVNAWVFVGMIVLLLAAAGVVILNARKKYRVR